MLKAHKIRLNPTTEQAEYLKRCCGIARFAYNWALEEWNRQYQEGRKPNIFALKKQFNAIKKEQFCFTTEVTKWAAEGAFFDLQAAFRNFFRKTANYPKFKSKKRSKPSFSIGNSADSFKVWGHTVFIPRLGWVDAYESLRLEGRIVSIRITFDADWWWVSIVIDVDHTPPVNNGPAIGIDVGLKDLAVLSNGERFENQKPLRKTLRKIKHLHRELSRKEQGSNNREKTRIKLARAYYRLSCIRQDSTHKLTVYLAKNYSVIGIEDLNIEGMLQNHSLALSISDAAIGEVFGQLGYKCLWFGSALVETPRFFASSKLCNECGYKNDNLKLSDRFWTCLGCGAHLDRDLNAARNIEAWVLAHLPGSGATSGSKTACGLSSGRDEAGTL